MYPHTDIVQIMIIVPLVIGALAVMITLCYASWLDILDRRVPFVTWWPMLVVGLPMAGVAFLSLYDGVSLLTGYIQMISVVLYIAYLGNRDDQTPLNVMFATPVVLVQLYSVWYFTGIHATPGVLLSVTTLLITAYATWLEARNTETMFSNAWPLLYLPHRCCLLVLLFIIGCRDRVPLPRDDGDVLPYFLSFRDIAASLEAPTHGLSCSLH